MKVFRQRKENSFQQIKDCLKIKLAHESRRVKLMKETEDLERAKGNSNKNKFVLTPKSSRANS